MLGFSCNEDLNTAKGVPERHFPVGHRLNAFGALPLTFLQIGPHQLGDAELVALQAATNELALHSKPGKINLRRLVTYQVPEGRFLPFGIRFRLVIALIHVTITRWKYQNVNSGF